MRPSAGVLRRAATTGRAVPPRAAVLALVVTGAVLAGGVVALAKGAASGAPGRDAAAGVHPNVGGSPSVIGAGGVSPSALPASAGAPVAPLMHPLAADVFVTTTHPITPPELAAMAAAGHVTSSLLFDTAQVHLASGQTQAIGVDPSTFRAYTPANTASSDPLWASVAAGNLAVAQAVGAALAVPLGGNTAIGTTTLATIRVGAYATTGLPGVGVVVDHSLSARLGLVSGGAVLLTAAGRDPVLTGQAIAKALGAGYQVSTIRVPAADGRLTWVAPAIGPITSPFGVRNNPNDPGHPEFHGGIDIGAPLGSPIYAAAAGVVQYAGPASGFGNEVIIQHAGGITTVYGHMRVILVRSGPVHAGQPIALVGAEGDATGPHLHFEVHVNDQRVDPLGWLKEHGVQVSK